MSMAGCEAKRAQGSDIAARARVMKQKQVIDAPFNNYVVDDNSFQRAVTA